MSSEEVSEIRNEEATDPIVNEVIETTNEEQPTEEIKEEETTTTPIEQIKDKMTPSQRLVSSAALRQEPRELTAKKLPRTVKVVELVECGACQKKMLPKSLRNTHPYYCKGQPTETLPVNRQKASYATKVEQKLRKEIEEEMRKKYETKDVIHYSEHEVSCNSAMLHEPLETRTKPKPSVPIVPSVPKQLTATELLQQSYNEMKRLRQQEKQ